jgi:HlyD family secretion protein
MRWHNLITFIREAKSSPRVIRAFEVMDGSIRFMTRRTHPSTNPAMAAVRAPLVAGLWVMLILAGTILVWGALAPIDSATVAKGTIVLLSNKKVVQHLEGGIIEEILVKEGDAVTANQPVMRLSNATATANLNILQGQFYAAQAAEARLLAERNGSGSIDFDEHMIEFAKTDEEVAKVMVAQTHLFLSEMEAQQAKLSVLDQRIAQSQEEIVGLRSQIDGLSEQMKLYSEEISTVEALLKQGHDTRPHLLELQRRQSELQGNRGQFEANILKSEQNIIETRMQIINQQKEFETKVSQDLKDAQAQIADLKDKLNSANDVVDRTVITAPTGGIVNGLKYHTSGGVIAPGTPIMDIIPQNDLLVIEAHVKPNDISAVHTGLNARIVFTSYKMRTTPKVPGKVTQVSADTFSDDKSLQAAPYYAVHIEIDKKFLQNIETPIELYPGLPADVLILTGSQSFLSYLFSPIIDSMHSAFREG